MVIYNRFCTRVEAEDFLVLTSSPRPQRGFTTVASVHGSLGIDPLPTNSEFLTYYPRPEKQGTLYVSLSP